VFETRLQVGGRRKRETLQAQTATDAVREQRAPGEARGIQRSELRDDLEAAFR
jgi:hypothetical protein